MRRIWHSQFLIKARNVARREFIHIVIFNICKHWKTSTRYSSGQFAYFFVFYLCLQEKNKVCKWHNNVPEKSGFALHIIYEKHYENVKYIVTHSKILHSHLFNLQFSHTGSSCWRHVFLILAVRRCLLVLNLRLLRQTLGNSSG